MQTKRFRGAMRKLPIAALTALLIVLGLAVAPASVAYDPAYSVPTGLKSTGQTDTTVSLSWVKSANVPQYRVQVYTRADMADSVYYRFTDSAVVIPNLVKSTAYNFRVRGISADGGTSLTAYSAPVTATTAAAPAYAVPTGLKSTGQTDTTVSLSWVKSANVPQYRVQVYTRADMADSVYYRFTDFAVVIPNLVKSTAYNFRVRGISADGGTSLTAYSAPVTATTAAAPAYAVPTGLKSTATAATSVSLSWNPVPNAPEYRVQIYSKPDMSDSIYRRFTAASGVAYGLTPETGYSARVRVIGSAGESLSAYSAPFTFTTPVDPYPTPTGFSATTTYRTANLTWNPVPNAPGYRLAIATKPDMSDAEWRRYAGTNTAEIRGLNQLTTYYFQVRVIDDAGTALSAYTPVLSIATKAEPPAPPALTNPLKVASYNVMCATCTPEDTDTANPLPWSERRGAVVANIKSRMPDIIGVQEASQGWLNEPGQTVSLSQFEDLLQRLNSAGANYAVSNNKRNNCVDSTTPTNCVYADQGASQGARIFYNPTAVEIVKSGSKALPVASVPENPRFFAWAIAKQKSTGKLFFFGDTHLSTSKAEGFYELRKLQAETIVSVIRQENSAGLPILMTGDLNSSKWQKPSNAPYDVFTNFGLIDPLGNDYWQDFPSMAATAEKRINAFLDSWNGYNIVAPGTSNKAANGSYIDYILTSKMRVSQWETVANVDSAGNFVGIIPSDHNMVVATVGLP
ncbi:endonuclease/exonuclease/phosphatase family metal-dependent hydrolase [Arthrobacter pascens]|uniref:fibronectin type III domain-containing protein n=1 Tax=Arthrobacter pascens TaxID=1677 RepID=UPI00278AC6B0|nr:fibronectin type III domain-containing protein [Arthrobacter pascens]MDQ0633527.1 endonuclease/exonuclease/phosphatase family metal-dependent hydrolase [Arthrobacter pascens]